MSRTTLLDNCHFGDTSSCLDDIGNDNFQVLRIDEDDLVFRHEEDDEADEDNRNSRHMTHGSIESISNILDRVDSV